MGKVCQDFFIVNRVKIVIVGFIDLQKFLIFWKNDKICLKLQPTLLKLFLFKIENHKQYKEKDIKNYL